MVVIHRPHRDTVHIRIVWKGGEVTTLDLPIPVGAWRELRAHAELERRVVDLHHPGLLDATIAERLTAEGDRSPMNASPLLPSTVRGIRLKHKLFVTRSQSHPRRIPGFLTIPQLARGLDVSPHWLYDRLAKGTIQIRRDPATGLYLFPDTQGTWEQFHQFKDGHLRTLCFMATTTEATVAAASSDTASKGQV